MILAAGAAVGGFVLTDTDEAPPPTTTTTSTTTSTSVPTTTTAADPVGDLADAYADRLADELGLAPGPAELDCLALKTLEVIGPSQLTELGEHPVLPELDSVERAALIEAIVVCLGPDAASQLLGEQTTTILPPISLPDEGAP